MSAFRTIFIRWWILLIALYLVKQPLATYTYGDNDQLYVMQSLTVPATEYLPKAQWSASGHDIKINTGDFYHLLPYLVQVSPDFLSFCLFKERTGKQKTRALIIIFPFHEFW